MQRCTTCWINVIIARIITIHKTYKVAKLTRYMSLFSCLDLLQRWLIYYPLCIWNIILYSNTTHGCF